MSPHLKLLHIKKVSTSYISPHDKNLSTDNVVEYARLALAATTALKLLSLIPYPHKCYKTTVFFNMLKYNIVVPTNSPLPSPNSIWAPSQSAFGINMH